MLNSCPYQKCTQAGIELDTLFCPGCKSLLSWCRKCNSANHRMGRYCRFCGEEQGQGLEWRMFKSGPHLTSCSQFGLRYPQSRDGFSKIWSTRLRNEDKAKIEASPIAAYGELVCADSSGNVFFLNQSNGVEVKRLSVGERVAYTPAANSIYVCVATEEALSCIVLLPEKRLHWRYPLRDGQKFSSHLVTEGDSIYVNAFNEAKKEFQLYRFLPDREKPKWIGQAFPSERAPSMPIAVNDHLLVGTHEGNVLVFDREEGKLRARLPERNLIEEGIDVSVAPGFCRERTYFFDRKGSLHSVRLTHLEGLKVESFHLGSFGTIFINQFALSELCMLIGCGEGVINADVDGSMYWNTQIHNLGNIKTSPVFCGEVALVGGGDGYVYCFDLANRHNVRYQKHRFSEKGTQLFVVAANERFFVLSDKGEMGAYTLRT